MISDEQMLIQKTHQTSDDAYLDGVALNLHGFYTGAEQILESIVRATGEGLPEAS